MGLRKHHTEISDQIEGSVERVTFKNDETGFCVLQIKTKGQAQLTTVVGFSPHIVPGEWVQAKGRWTVDRQYGKQFQAEQLTSSPPDSLKGIEKFLASGLIKGIGPVYASKLVGALGKDVFDVIENQSALLEKVEGIGRVRRLRIKEGWNATKTIRAIMTFLLSHGVGTSRAFRIFKAYGDLAIQTVRSDPYCLARDIKGIGFKVADQIASQLNISKTSTLRAKAGIEYVLEELTRQGHCAFPQAALIQQTAQLLEVPEELVSKALEISVQEKRLVCERLSNLEDLVFLASLRTAEVELAKALQSLSAAAHPTPGVDVSKAIAWS